MALRVHQWKRHRVWSEARRKVDVDREQLQCDVEKWLASGHTIEKLDSYTQKPYRKPPVMWTR